VLNTYCVTRRAAGCYAGCWGRHDDGCPLAMTAVAPMLMALVMLVALLVLPAGPVSDVIASSWARARILSPDSSCAS
jgi:hypothetical protein